MALGDNWGISLEFTEELIARHSPVAQAIIRALLAQNAAFMQQVAALKREVAELKDR